MKIRTLFIVSLFLFGTHLLQGQNAPDFIRYLNHSWVDSCLRSMTLQEKVGQLFIIDVYSNNDKAQYKKVEQIIERYKPGGIIFMRGESEEMVRLANEFQQQSKLPLLTCMDAEWGPAFRLKGTPKYPVQMALGALKNDSLIYRMGMEVGAQLKQLGVGVNFAPVADVNNNPDNPVINFRSFGENPKRVAQKSWMYAKGMQDAGVLAVAKHFPGHGDTNTDSHLGLPIIKHKAEHLDSVELKPFNYLINRGIAGMMTAHIHVPNLDRKKKIPASLSKKIIQNKLIDEFGFSGLIVTDGMNMHGITKTYKTGDAAVKALQAGNDLLEIVPDISAATKAVEETIKKGEISESEIDWKCRKILAAKKWLGLDKPDQNSALGINSPRYELTKQLLHEQSLTLLRNNKDLLPLERLDTLKIASISIGKNNQTSFQTMLGNYMTVDHFQLDENASTNEIQKLTSYLNNYNLLIIGIHKLNLGPKSNYGVEPTINQFFSQLPKKKKIISLFGNPYALKFIDEAFNCNALLITYQENRITQELAAQAIFGAIDVNGTLPVSVNANYREGTGIEIKKNGRLKYTIPEEVGISSSLLESKIDSIAQFGLTEEAYPGCQILIARSGKVIFHKCYGFHTYKKQKPVLKENIYDWASVTKITGPLPALIKLHGEKKFQLDVPFYAYWPDFRNSNKNKLSARTILAHQAGLQAWIPYWHNTLKKNGKLRKTVFKDHPTSRFDLRVSSNLYMKGKYQQKMFDEIRDSELIPNQEYKYSGLAFYLFPKIIENITGQDYESYLKNTFYLPLGASTVTFNAYKHFPKGNILPTENDQQFRNELLQGFVHDEGAAMMGGVSGNAGLFGTATDLAKIMQMYLQKGKYGGTQFFEENSINEFTRIQYPENENRRGIGFDKPYIDNDQNILEEAYPAVSASKNSFGHSGYTGTFCWADPDNELLFIFMSNRVYPSRENTKLFDLNLRPSLHQAIYDCFSTATYSEE